jgi:integrase
MIHLVAGRPARGKSRVNGNIELLPSGSLRARVYAGIDPVSKKRHYLTELIPAGPKAQAQADASLDRLVSQVREQRHPRTRATVDQLITRYLDQFDGAPSTLDHYRGYVRNHISPFIGHIPVGSLDADTLDAFYAELRRCRRHCSGRRPIQHRTAAEHKCDQRCQPHVCKPLGATTIRHMHFILSGAYKRAVRWRWVTVSPIGQAEPPAAPKPNPQPPTSAEAARVVNEAWQDLDWGTLVWVAMTTGARRGELCAVRWSLVDLGKGRETIWLRRAIRKEHGEWVEADLKTHQQRRIALDPETALVLHEYRERCRQQAAALSIDLDPGAFVFSQAPDRSEFRNPEGVTQRYDRLAERLKIDTTFHKLRHYSATELISAGVDVRTVAGRLGHSGGGTTTLRTYSAWVSEADQRAARGLGSTMPDRPAAVHETERAKTDPRYPYEKIAAKIQQQIITGKIPDGTALPPEKQFIIEHGISTSTARRVIALLRQWGFLTPSGRHVIVPETPQTDEGPDHRSPIPASEPENTPNNTEDEFWSVTLRGPDGQRYPARLVRAKVTNPDSFRSHLVGIARIETPNHIDDRENWVTNFELEVRQAGGSQDEPALLTLRWDEP